MPEPQRDRRIPDLVSATQAAEIIGVTRQAVQLWAADGVIRGAKVGSTWVFRRETVEAFKTFRASEMARTDDDGAGE